MATYTELEKEILQLINSHREKLNLAPLVFNHQIQETAWQHTENMATGKTPFGHDGFNERANSLIPSLNGTSAAENVAFGQRSAEEVVKSWLQSSGHRKNIEGDYNLTGVSVVNNQQNEPVYTQIFIKTNGILSEAPPATTVSEHAVVDKAENLNYSILKLINQHRASQYLNTLQINPHVQATAKEHAELMASGARPFGHEYFKERANDLLVKVGAIAISENVAFGPADSQVIVQSWLESEGHRKNIEGDFNLTGLGIAKDSEGALYYCQIFLKKE